MAKLSKRTIAAMYMEKNEALFTCPICSSSMNITNLMLVCQNQHTFDIARQGYVHLLTKHVQTKYNRGLFEARRKVIAENAFFDPLIEKITHMIVKQIGDEKSLVLADMGCGEGSILHNIRGQLETKHNKDITTIGLDLAKTGILEAAKNYEQTMWLVADLANPPLQVQSIDVVLNILSPSNYDSFKRLVTENGIILKVVPRYNHLQEIRNAFYPNDPKQENAEHDVIDHFKNHFTIVDRAVVQYKKKLDPSVLKALVEMTPLTWEINEHKIGQFLRSGNRAITVDLEVIIGKG